VEGADEDLNNGKKRFPHSATKNRSIDEFSRFFYTHTRKIFEPPTISLLSTGLPDFSWYKNTKMGKNVPTLPEKYQIAIQYIKMPRTY
jgi:hypothetical protein